jgi:hypothetical protein
MLGWVYRIPMRAGLRFVAPAIVLVALSACAPFPPALACVDVVRVDCLTARDVASELLGVDVEAVGVVVRRYRPDVERIGRQNPDFGAYVEVISTGDGPTSIVLVMRQVAGEPMRGIVVVP